MLGTRVRDMITGFSGVVTGFVEYISGCNQALVIPPVDEKGAMQEGQWFDIQRLERLGDSLIVLDNGQAAGPDMPAPKR